jgi:uncharacterized protein (DUF1499 family)
MCTVRPIAAAVLAAGLVASAFGLRQFMSGTAQDRLLPGEEVDIAGLRPPLPRPSFLACPAGYCHAAEASASPIFAVPWRQLRDGWRRMIEAEPRIVEVASDPHGRRLTYIAHTALFGFPDIVTVEFAAFGSNGSGIALFSRSRYGRSDLGTNRRRVERWLTLLQKLEPILR